MPRSPSDRLPRVGTGVAVALVALAMLLPALTGWNVHVFTFPPLHADWGPRVGVGTLPAVVLAVLATRHAARVAEHAEWRRLLGWAFLASLAWLLALALVDGLDGIRQVLDGPYEYLHTAREYHDFGALLPGWIGRMSYAAIPYNWPVHVAGHPPGATLFFWVLARLDLGSGLAAGLVVTVVAATTPLAMLSVLRSLGAEQHARRVLPFLVFGPAAIWSAVSADAVFGSVAAWGMASLAVAATAPGWGRRVGWSVLAGLLLGAMVMLSYGLPLMGLLALVILWLASRHTAPSPSPSSTPSRSPSPTPPDSLNGGKIAVEMRENSITQRRRTHYSTLLVTAGAALAVVLAFAAYGFNYVEALGVLHTRYWEGIASRRPPQYWMWANLAALVLSAGPLMAAGMALVLGRARTLLRDPATQVVAALALAGFAMVAIADLSQLSRAEVDRIWLPFEPWLLLSCALLPEQWRRRGLVAQVVLALVIQHLLRTGW